MNTFWGRVKQRYSYSLILLKQLVITDFKLRYQGSVLGYVWSLLRPLFLFMILYAVFGVFLSVGSDIPHYPVYLLLGIVFWNYFVEVTSLGVTSIVSKGDLIRKLNFPKTIIVVAGSFSALINLLINFMVIVVFVILNHIHIHLLTILLIPLVAELFLLSLGLAFFLSALFVRLRDLSYLWEVFLQGAFYATPILYPFSKVIGWSNLAAKILLLNPVAQIIQDSRRVLLMTNKAVTFEDIYHNGAYRLLPIAAVVLIFVVSLWYFRRQAPSFAEEV